MRLWQYILVGTPPLSLKKFRKMQEAAGAEHTQIQAVFSFIKSIRTFSLYLNSRSRLQAAGGGGRRGDCYSGALPIKGAGLGGCSAARWPLRGSRSPFRWLVPPHGRRNISHLVSVGHPHRGDKGADGHGRVGGGKDQEAQEEGQVLSGGNPTTRTPASCGGDGSRRRTGLEPMPRVGKKQIRTILQIVGGFLQKKTN